MSDRLRQIEELFHAALATPAHARDRFLADACEDDEMLRREVSELLALTSTDNDVFERPPTSGAGLELAPGSRLGPYEIETLVAAGGMGEIYRARDTRLRRTVALKLLPTVLRTNPDLRARFDREARTLAGLSHPHICALHDVGQDRDVDFLVMEYVDGETVADALRRGPLPIEMTIRIGAAVASALAAAHAQGLVHRDVKPSNIIVTRDGVPKLVDFGLAATAADFDAPTEGCDSRLTRTGVFVGTLLYMSPEQAVRQPLDSRTDVFSLGVVLFECLTGRRPFEGDTQSAYLKNLFLARPQPLRALRSDVPPALEQLVMRCLEKDPGARQISASDLASALADFAVSRERGRAAGLLGWAAAIVVLLAAAAGAAWKWEAAGKRLGSSPDSHGAAVGFHARDWVLVTRFDNRTGDRQFDRIIESVLEYELNNSAYVNVVPPTRVDAALKLMVKPPDTVVSAAIGREVALRDGDIRFVIGGEIELFGTGYAITVRVTDPSTGATGATTREEAAGTDGVQRAVHRLSDWVRLTLGEAPVLVKNDDAQLEKVTTPSPRALELYSQARRVFDRNDMPAAEAMLGAALAQDPDFASAHIWLAWTYANLKRPQDAIAAEAKRAADLAATTTERERYWILASYYILTLQDQRALGQLEALTQRFPNDFWAVRNLSEVYTRLGRKDDATRLAPRFADVEPGNFVAQATAANILLQTRGIGDAQPYVDRAKRLLSLPNPRPEGWANAAKVWLALLPAHEEWAAGHAADAARVLDSATGRPEFRLDPVNTLNMLGKMRLALGQLTLADQTFDGIPNAAMRALGKSEVALARNDMRSVISILNAARPADFSAASMLVEAGDLDGARRLLDEMPKINQTHARWTAEQIREARGDVDQITEALGNGVPWAAVMTGARTFYYSKTLARAAATLGKVDAAIRILEQTSPVGARAYAFFTQSGFHWMRTQKLLADLYRQTGQIAKADAVERDLLARLAVADPDYPLLVELKQRASATQARNVGAPNKISGRDK